MQSGSEVTLDSDGNEDEKCLKSLSITELISISRTGNRTRDHDRVEITLKAEIDSLYDKQEMERLETMNAEGELKKSFLNGDTHVAIVGSDEEISGVPIRVSSEAIDEECSEPEQVVKEVIEPVRKSRTKNATPVVLRKKKKASPSSVPEQVVKEVIEPVRKSRTKNATPVVLRKKKKASSSSVPPLFHSEELKRRFKKELAKKKITGSRYVKLSFLKENNFEIRGALEPFKYFLELENDCSPIVVQAFYYNLSFDSVRTVLKSFIRGTEIVLDCETLAGILHLPTAGGLEFTENPKSVRNLEGYDWNTCIGRLMNLDEVPEDSDFGTVKLNVHHKLLKYIVAHCFVNKSGNFAYVSDSEILMMYCILEGKKFNFPYFMLHRMALCARKDEAPLPYASVITEILQHFEVHPFEDERDSPGDVNLHNVCKMGFVKDGSDWVRKKEVQARKRKAQNRIPPPPPPQPSQSSTEPVFLEHLNNIKHEFNAKLEDMEAKVSEILQWTRRQPYFCSFDDDKNGE